MVHAELAVLCHSELSWARCQVASLLVLQLLACLTRLLIENMGQSECACLSHSTERAVGIGRCFTAVQHLLHLPNVWSHRFLTAVSSPLLELVNCPT